MISDLSHSSPVIHATRYVILLVPDSYIRATRCFLTYKVFLVPKVITGVAAEHQISCRSLQMAVSLGLVSEVGSLSSCVRVSNSAVSSYHYSTLAKPATLWLLIINHCANTSALSVSIRHHWQGTRFQPTFFFSRVSINCSPGINKLASLGSFIIHVEMALSLMLRCSDKSEKVPMTASLRVCNHFLLISTWLVKA